MSLLHICVCMRTKVLLVSDQTGGCAQFCNAESHCVVS